jgi:hypothetical protein
MWSSKIQRHRVRTLACLIVALVAVPVPSSGAQALVVDQSFTEPTNLGANINECCAFIGQTFTAGRTGLLEGINIDVAGFGSTHLHVAIRTVQNGTPTATVLGETVLPTNTALLSDLIKFPQQIRVEAGIQYTIVVNYEGAPPPGPGQFQGIWYGATGDPYQRGALVGSVDGSSWFESSQNDVHFRTYVSVLPTSKNQCKKNGWQEFGVFKNQGDCVAFVATVGKNPPG